MPSAEQPQPPQFGAPSLEPQTPIDRLRETWSLIRQGEGWEYAVLKTTIGFTLPTALLAGYLTRSASNRQAIFKQLTQQNMVEPALSKKLESRLFFANLKSGVTVGGRLALVPISVCAIAISSISYRNAVFPLDLGLLYGAAAAALTATRAGAKTTAIASAGAAAFGIGSGLLINFLLERNNISIEEMRHQFALEYQAAVEYQKVMAAMKARDLEHRRVLVEQERKQMQERRSRE